VGFAGRTGGPVGELDVGQLGFPLHKGELLGGRGRRTADEGGAGADEADKPDHRLILVFVAAAAERSTLANDMYAPE
jgi:hypothetical protein